jgi:hypothetical protein
MWSILKRRSVGLLSENRFGNCSWLWRILKANRQSALSVPEELNPVKGDDMSNNPDIVEDDDDMRKEYDFTHAVRGKYTDRFPQDVVMVTLAPDVAEAFPDADAVNEALRILIKAAEKVARAA